MAALSRGQAELAAVPAPSFSSQFSGIFAAWQELSAASSGPDGGHIPEEQLLLALGYAEALIALLLEALPQDVTIYTFFDVRKRLHCACCCVICIRCDNCETDSACVPRADPQRSAYRSAKELQSYYHIISELS